MSVIEAAYEVLREAGEPLHYREITKRMLKRGLWATQKEKPWATVYAELLIDSGRQGGASRFEQTGRGEYKIRKPQLLLLNVAERVLRESGSNNPMHYSEIAKRAVAAGFIKSKGNCPASWHRLDR